ncbi:L-aspartate 1-decarboxylase [Caloramator fervidus]|uniref:Aspartate 1-decarboxylase n=1 Tax=Caloramator fervidus TaxID=29344 RepID=A0A1H5UWS1_9CLOT|nr:aspartate 1-decarboxylase [Caloramator fervidus]SEF78878.1 L-aspartate 1-decarboxylase [Caloramator fervidus]
MLLNMLKAKIHRATVTEANLNYVGSITIDEELMDAVGIYENERVQIVNINNGERFDTYVIKGERGKGQICLNGAAARLVHPGDKIIIMAYCFVEEKEAKFLKPKVILVDDNNRIVEYLHEEHGKIV